VHVDMTSRRLWCDSSRTCWRRRRSVPHRAPLPARRLEAFADYLGLDWTCSSDVWAVGSARAEQLVQARSRLISQLVSMQRASCRLAEVVCPVSHWLASDEKEIDDTTRTKGASPSFYPGGTIAMTTSGDGHSLPNAIRRRSSSFSAAELATWL